MIVFTSTQSLFFILWKEKSCCANKDCHNECEVKSRQTSRRLHYAKITLNLCYFSVLEARFLNVETVLCLKFIVWKYGEIKKGLNFLGFINVIGMEFTATNLPLKKLLRLHKSVTYSKLTQHLKCITRKRWNQMDRFLTCIKVSVQESKCFNHFCMDTCCGV